MTQREIDAAILVEQKLAVLAKTMAVEIGKPFSQRDRREIQSIWEKIASQKRRLLGLRRPLLKIKRPSSREVMSKAEYNTSKKLYLAARPIIKRMQLWDQVETLVQNHITPVEKPLIEQNQTNPVGEILEMVDGAFHKLANQKAQDQTAIEQQCFSDIPLPIQMFNVLMLAAYRVNLVLNRSAQPKFLDVGCGGGTRAFVASYYFPIADGLEFDSGYVAAARATNQVIGATRTEIIEANALTFDGYNDYDIIYFYRPLQDDALLTEMEQRIIENARPKTVIVAPYSTQYETHHGMTCALVERPIFVTGISQSEADQIGKDARRTSNEIITSSRSFSYDTGFWAPILDAATVN